MLKGKLANSIPKNNSEEYCKVLSMYKYEMDDTISVFKYVEFEGNRHMIKKYTVINPTREECANAISNFLVDGLLASIDISDYSTNDCLLRLIRVCRSSRINIKEFKEKAKRIIELFNIRKISDINEYVYEYLV